MNYIALIGLVLVTGYLITTVKLFGVPKSISDSWYLYARKGYSDVFAWFIIGLGCLIAFMPLAYTYTHDASALWMGTGAFLCGIGIAANFKDKKPGIIHVICTYTAILGAFAAHIINSPEFVSFLPLIVSVVGLILLKVFRVKNFTWWMEIVLIYAILIGEL
jgi:hypothetical protein